MVLLKNDHYKKKQNIGHVYITESVSRTVEKLRKTIFRYKMINFLLMQVNFSGNIDFSYTEKLSIHYREMIKKQHCC